MIPCYDSIILFDSIILKDFQIHTGMWTGVLPVTDFLPNFVLRASLIRPAPAEFPQDRKVARVGGCSGAM